jgi:NAD+ synthase (glutamine-hydrolysing)
VRLGLAQVDVRVGDFGANARRILEAVREAAAGRAELVVFPELVVTGYPPRDLLLDPAFVDEALRTTEAIARRTADGPALVLGSLARAPWSPPGHPGLYDVAALLHQGRVAATRAKRLLPTYDVFNEARWFMPGEPSAPLELCGRRTGLIVCEDLWAEGYRADPGAELVSQGAELLVCPSASPFRPRMLAERLRLARRLSVPVVYVNAIGANDDVVFDGGSFATGADGALRALLPRFEDAVQVVDLDSAEPLPDPAPDGDGETFGALVLGVRDFARKNGLRRAFVGLSGGIDSALVACIAREALGPEGVRALAIPSRYTDPRSTDAARSLCGALGVAFEVLPLGPLHAAAEQALRPLLEGGARDDATAENLQARLRALILMAHVNRHGGLLLNTSNKTELALGYGTLYGDLAGALSVIGDLTKPEVYALARFYDRGREVIPPFVLERAPSAELRPEQVDPFDYPRVAPIVEALIRGDAPPAGAEAGEVRRLAQMIRAAEHKRWQAGIVLKVSQRAFGPGRMIPVTRA